MGVALLAFAVLCGAAPAQDTETYELPPINYSQATPHDPISRLQAELRSGKLQLPADDRGVVVALLGALHISPASQVLVFSKTSFQNDRISPRHPRALYFTDDCYFGWVPGGLAELAAIDPVLGPVFYSFDPRAPTAGHARKFERGNDCLRCHGGHFVGGIPGVFVRSVYAAESGEPIYRQGTEVVDYRTPFEQRWGGWYVTGTHGGTTHRGNTFAAERGDELVFDPAHGANRTNLDSFCSLESYLSPGSDLVALLVLEHQTAMQNLLTRAGLNCRHMLDYQTNLQSELKESVNGEEPVYDSVRGMFDHAAEEIVDGLLFKDEAALPEKFAGTSDFAATFAQGAPRTAEAGSLKDLLTGDHLFKNRCSYLIYSATYQALPAALKRRVAVRLGQALDAEHPAARYTFLHRAERVRIAAILRATHPDFRAGFPSAESGPGQ